MSLWIAVAMAMAGGSTLVSGASAAQQESKVIPGSSQYRPSTATTAKVGEGPALAAMPTHDAGEIAEDSARDLKDGTYYNKPGATRAQYDAAWQECRLIARGSRTPGGTVVTTYNPAIISPVVAGLAAGVGGFIGNAIVEGQMRRANRRSCLAVHGWRLVTVDPAERARIAALSPADRDGFFARAVGEAEPEGQGHIVEQRIRGTAPRSGERAMSRLMFAALRALLLAARPPRNCASTSAPTCRNRCGSSRVRAPSLSASGARTRRAWGSRARSAFGAMIPPRRTWSGSPPARRRRGIRKPIRCSSAAATAISPAIMR